MKKRSFLTFLESQIKSLLCTSFLALAIFTPALAQEKEVTGTVVSAEDNSPMIGVNVVIKGTTIGTTTDVNGNFSISLTGENPVLVFSFIGYNAQEVSAGNQSVLNIKMVAAPINLEEIVVTSLGIKREKKALTYSAQAVAPEELSKARDLNVINSLSGLVAGIDIIKSNSGVGSPTRVVLRGNRSIYGNNQPLYIVDGAPISNNSSTPYTDWGGVAMGDGIGNVNPEDIESITVLKGPSAAAIYGSRANNGAIIINTKKGTGRKGVGIEYSLNYSVETPVILTRFQNIYGQGNQGLYFNNSGSGWGPVMDGRDVEHWTLDTNSPKYGTTYPFIAHPDNYKEFFRLGTNLTNSIAFSAGNQDIQGYFSFTNTQSNGIIPGNDLQRDNLNLRVTARMSKRLSLDAKITSFHQNVNNRVPTGDGALNPVRSVLLQPGNITLEDAKDYEFVDTNGFLSQNYWIPDNLYNNQYWIINRDPSKDFRNRTLSVVSAKYEFIDGLSLQVRTSSDYIYDKSSQNLYNDTFMVASRGNYLAGQSNTSELNNDLLLNYNKNVTSSFSLNVSAGGNMLTQKNYQMNTSNTELLAPNLFTTTNAMKLTATEYGSTKNVNSLYGFATLGLKNWLFLDLTIRNDWSSTLPPESWSYFYPSAGLTWIVSDMIKSRPGWLTFAKLRASLARVGNDTDPYQLDPSFSFQPGGELGYLRRGWTKPPTSLKPEITSSGELGFDIRFLHNRIGLDLTWYKSNSKNQLLWVRVPAASGYVEKFVNAGNIQNSGIEATLNLKLLEGGFKWDMAINFAKNNSLVVALAEGLKDFTLTGGQLTLIKVVEGSGYGDIFTRGFVRNEAGRKLIDEYGMPITTNGQDLLMGNYNPDWIGGIRNSFAWKGFDFSFLVDIRMGGDVFSTTQSYLAADGYADYTLEGRDGMVVDGIIQTLDEDGNVISERENDVEITAEAYWQHLGGRDGQVGEVYKYDGSNIRVSEMVLGYTKNFKSSVIRSINISLVGRNLFFILNKAKIVDPNLMVGNNNAQGNESYGLPGTRTIGMNLRATF